MKKRMKRSYWLRLISSNMLMIMLLNPVSAAFALDTAVSASAVVVPAQASQLGFVISGIAKEIPVKEGDVITAGQTLMVLDTPDLQFAVTEAQAALHSTQAYADLQKYQKVKNQRNGKTVYDTVPEEYRQRVEARVQQAHVALELAQINFAEGTLTAPFDGIIASIKVIPGEFVQADQGVVTLATLNNLQLETIDLSERDITQVKIGTPVSISMEALNENFNGEVVSISPMADTVGGDVVFKVTIAFDKQPKGLLWGMTAEVTINK
jgi:RND family efflux transporter MFP subunit